MMMMFSISRLLVVAVLSHASMAELSETQSMRKRQPLSSSSTLMEEERLQLDYVKGSPRHEQEQQARNVIMIRDYVQKALLEQEERHTKMLQKALLEQEERHTKALLEHAEQMKALEMRLLKQFEQQQKTSRQVFEKRRSNRRMKERVSSLTSLEKALECVDQSKSTDKDLYFKGCNVHIINGKKKTTKVNGFGNLIVGYNEEIVCNSGQTPCVRSGSHNVIIGQSHEYGSYGAIVAGDTNSALGAASCVPGGNQGLARGDYSSITGGFFGYTTGAYASVTGGTNNFAQGLYASVHGGFFNEADGQSASILGGDSNNSTSKTSAVVGGNKNRVFSQSGVVVGGQNNTVDSAYATILGGLSNIIAAGNDFTTLPP